MTRQLTGCHARPLQARCRGLRRRASVLADGRGNTPPTRPGARADVAPEEHQHGGLVGWTEEAASTAREEDKQPPRTAAAGASLAQATTNRTRPAMEMVTDTEHAWADEYSPDAPDDFELRPPVRPQFHLSLTILHPKVIYHECISDPATVGRRAARHSGGRCAYNAVASARRDLIALRPPAVGRRGRWRATNHDPTPPPRGRGPSSSGRHGVHGTLAADSERRTAVRARAACGSRPPFVADGGTGWAIS